MHEPKKHTPVGAIDPDAMKFNLRDAAGLLRNRTILFMAVQVMLTTSLVLFAFFITYWVDDRGWTTADAALLMSAYMLGAVISRFIGGLLGDWFEKRFGHKGRVIMMQGYLVAYALSTALLFQIDWGTGVAVYVAVFLTGLLSSLGHPGAVLPIVGSVVHKSVVATAYAFIFSFVQGLFAALFSLAFGFLADSLGPAGADVLADLGSLRHQCRAVDDHVPHLPEGCRRAACARRAGGSGTRCGSRIRRIRQPGIRD